MPAMMQAGWRLTLEMWAWARILPLAIGRRDLNGIIALAQAAPVPRFDGISPQAIAERAVRLTRHPWLMRNRRCLRQGVLGYRFLRMAGHSPELHFGIERKSLAAQKVAAHCWVELQGTPVINACLEDMETVLVHKGIGQ